MNAQFQGIHSLNACCWVLCRHVQIFICLVVNLFHNHCDNIVSESICKAVKDTSTNTKCIYAVA